MKGNKRMNADIYMFFVMVFLAQFGALVFIYCMDRELKAAMEIDVKNVKLYKLLKYKYCFVYHKRKDGVITKYTFQHMLAYYSINFTWLLIVLVQIITGNNSYLIMTCSIFMLLNLGLLVEVPIFALNAEERKKMGEYRQKLFDEAQMKRWEKRDRKYNNSKRKRRSKKEKGPRLK